MPLRDHFRPPVTQRNPWDALHGAWPAMIVIDLNSRLPEEYLASPRIKLATGSLPATTELPEQDEYEVLIHEDTEPRRLVAAVEIVSPSNKDRPDHRRTFAAKCATLLQQGVSVSIIDVVTTRNFNRYANLIDLLGQTDPSLIPEPPPLYAAACRWRHDEPSNGARAGRSWRLETWAHAMEVGRSLPTLPLWLATDYAVPLELESTYEETCRVLRIA